MEERGKVWLAGAGPGDALLMTVKTKSLLETSDVIVYDALVSPEVLCQIPDDKERIYVGKRGGHHTAPQEEINQILLREAKKGKKVLRLKGGDPFVFGRGGEEVELLLEENIPFEIVPGITSAIAVPAYAGIPVTHRDFVSSVHIITGHARKGGKSRVNYKALAETGGTLVFLMGVSELKNITTGLMEAGLAADMPAAVVMQGTTSGQKTVLSDLEHLVQKVKEEKIHSPAIIIVGKVAALHKDYDWTGCRPLNGKMFVITRPKERISGLAARLRSAGAQVLELPAIETCLFHENKALEALKQNNNGERWLVFTSPAGVQAFFEELKELQMDLRDIIKAADVLKIAAIGSATAKELSDFGLRADLIPSRYYAKDLGEELAQKAAANSEIFILRAKVGSEELIPPLEEVGLIVHDIALYETKHRLNEWMQEQVSTMIENQTIDAVLFTSKSTVDGFVGAVPNADFKKITAICIGEQTAKEARKYSMQVLVSEKASIDSMLDMMIQKVDRG